MLNLLTRIGLSLSAGAVPVFCHGCDALGSANGSSENGDADAATPAPCMTDEECPDGISCILPDDTDEAGFCDVDETQSGDDETPDSMGTPAQCMTDEECPEGISCILPDGTDEAGFCDVDETEGP